MSSKAGEHYQAGRLDEAVAAQIGEVKAHPADPKARGFLCELLLFGADLQRIDVHLDAMGRLDPSAELGIAEFRQVVRAEQARRDCFTKGAMPEFVGNPTRALREQLRALTLLRAGDAGGAGEALAAVEEIRPHVAGTCDGDAFDDLRDLDDTCAPFVEVLTTTGKYFWIATEQIVSMDFAAPTRPRDLVWRQTEMSVRDGPQGVVYVPALYAGTSGSDDQATRLGRATDWLGDDGGPVRGVGQRMLLVGDEARSILGLSHIEFVRAGGDD